VVEHLSYTWEALGSRSSATKKGGKKDESILYVCVELHTETLHIVLVLGLNNDMGKARKTETFPLSLNQQIRHIHI
jgi:hypothetical protein